EPAHRSEKAPPVQPHVFPESLQAASHLPPHKAATTHRLLLTETPAHATPGAPHHRPIQTRHRRRARPKHDPWNIDAQESESSAPAPPPSHTLDPQTAHEAQPLPLQYPSSKPPCAA